MDAAPRSTGPLAAGATSDKKQMLLNNITEQVKELGQEAYTRLILRNHDVFSADKQDLGRTNIMEHSIEMKDDCPSYTKKSEFPRNTGQC